MSQFDELSDDQLIQRYEAAGHRRQSAVAFAQSKGDRVVVDNKHLRVGIDAAMSEQGGLVALLIDKKVFSNREYLEAITAAAEREAQTWVERVKRDYGLPPGVDFA